MAHGSWVPGEGEVTGQRRGSGVRGLRSEEAMSEIRNQTLQCKSMHVGKGLGYRLEIDNRLEKIYQRSEIRGQIHRSKTIWSEFQDSEASSRRPISQNRHQE